MSDPDPTTVVRSVVVPLDAQRAFDLFTTCFDAIKPREHNLLAAPIVETRLEGHVGGHIVDRAEDGSECRWSRILVWEPPSRLVFSWDISTTWQLETDLQRTSEVEVSFTPVESGSTRVEITHRHLDRHGPGWEQSIRDSLAGGDGWPRYLERFSELAP